MGRRYKMRKGYYVSISNRFKEIFLLMHLS